MIITLKEVKIQTKYKGVLKSSQPDQGNVRLVRFLEVDWEYNFSASPCSLSKTKFLGWWVIIYIIYSGTNVPVFVVIITRQ